MGLNFAIIGCGLIGVKRAQALDGKANLAVVCDTDLNKAKVLAEKYKTQATTQWKEAVTLKEVDAVVVAVTHNQLPEIALEAINAGKHVFLEKPGAKSPEDLNDLILQSQKMGVVVHVGFNHRFHPAIIKAKELIDKGELGELYFIRGRYGHGGRIGYDKEWRAKPEISGGGELLDQGAHLIDLSLFFFKESFETIFGLTQNYFWDMPVEDNGFLTLKTKSGKISHLHVTWTEWKNLFSFEITGKKAKIHIEGLGGSYGVEKLFFYKMKPEMGPPETTIFEYPFSDNSWNLEMDSFINAIEKKSEPFTTLKSTQEVLSVIQTVYKQNKVFWVS